jgi:RNA polymerase sigma-70 factor (family 1)
MIQAIKNGDTFAYEQAFLLYREKVYFYFYKKTKSGDDAKDLLQTTFLKLWQYRHSLSEDYLLEQHLFQIARTVYIDYLRQENKVMKVRKALSEKLEQTAVFYYTPSDFDLHARLYETLTEMPDQRKKVFELSRLEGYSYKEIAQMLSISVKAVDNNLAKALRQIKKAFIALLF